MEGETPRSWKGLLDPVNRISEVLFGLIMVLTFTGSLSVAEASQQEIRTMLFAAVGCNLAWGLVDAAMYLMVTLTERRHGMVMLRAVQNATDPAEAHRVIVDALPPLVASCLRSSELDTMWRLLQHLPEQLVRPQLRRDDWVAALAVFLLVFLAMFPVVIPFLVMYDARLALRVSNAVTIVMLFTTGYLLGRYAEYRPWRLGSVMVLVGIALVAITIALGG